MLSDLIYPEEYTFLQPWLASILKAIQFVRFKNKIFI
jgi:hypothetical protein